METMVATALIIVIVLVIAVSNINTWHLKVNYYKTYKGLIQLDKYKGEKSGKDVLLGEEITHRVKNGLYFTTRTLFGNLEMKVYTNLNGQIRCVETIEHDSWNASNETIKIKGLYKKEVENYLEKERKKMFEEVKVQYGSMKLT